MPKKVDHEQRRRLMARAVWSVTAERGLEAVTLRDVAAEAGVSMGLVQHYFSSKNEMLLYACEHIVELAAEGARADAEGTSSAPNPGAAIRGIALQTLPLDDDQQAGAGVWLAFLAAASTNPRLAVFMRRALTGTHQVIAEQLRVARSAGTIPNDVDPDTTATELVALITGLMVHVVIGHYTAAEATAAVDARLDRLLPLTPAAP